VGAGAFGCSSRLTVQEDAKSQPHENNDEKNLLDFGRYRRACILRFC